MEISLVDVFQKGGWVMWPLLILSVISWGVVFERAFVFLSLKPKLNRLSETLLKSLREKDIAAAKQVCLNSAPPLSELFLTTVDTRKPKESAERANDRNWARMTAHLKRNLWLLGTIGSASPFIGLLGTVVGIIRAFHNMSEKGSGGFSVVAGGISEALIATGAGLVVAIVALFAYNIYVTAANQMLSGLRITLDELLDEAFSTSPKQA